MYLEKMVGSQVALLLQWLDHVADDHWSGPQLGVLPVDDPDPLLLLRGRMLLVAGAAGSRQSHQTKYCALQLPSQLHTFGGGPTMGEIC